MQRLNPSHRRKNELEIIEKEKEREKEREKQERRNQNDSSENSASVRKKTVASIAVPDAASLAQGSFIKQAFEYYSEFSTLYMSLFATFTGFTTFLS